MNTMDVILKNIHQKISTNDKDKNLNAEMFDEVTNWLIKEMGALDPVFKKLYKGYYSSQEEFLKPNEFNIFFILQFPFPMDVILLEGSPGYMRLNLKKTLKHLEIEANNRDIYEAFIKLIEKDFNQNCLNPFSLQSWIQNIIKKVLKTRSMPAGYKIQYNKSKETPYISVSEESFPDKLVSIDFATAIQINKGDKLENLKRFAKLKDIKSNNNFLAIPSLMPTLNTRIRRKDDRFRLGVNAKCAFQIINHVAEKELWEKENFKIVYLLLKSLCNHYGLNSLKDQFLTNIFLWEIKKHNEEFSNKPVGYLFIHMLGKLSKYFTERKMPYFWVESFDLFSVLKTKEIIDYGKILDEVCKKLKNDQAPLCYTKLSVHFKIPSEITIEV